MPRYSAVSNRTPPRLPTHALPALSTISSSTQRNAYNTTYSRSGQWHGWNLSRDMTCVMCVICANVLAVGLLCRILLATVGIFLLSSRARYYRTRHMPVPACGGAGKQRRREGFPDTSSLLPSMCRCSRCIITWTTSSPLSNSVSRDWSVLGSSSWSVKMTHRPVNRLFLSCRSWSTVSTLTPTLPFSDSVWSVQPVCGLYIKRSAQLQ